MEDTEENQNKNYPLKAKGEPGIVLEDILEKAGFKYCEPQK